MTGAESGTAVHGSSDNTLILLEHTGDRRLEQDRQVFQMHSYWG